MKSLKLFCLLALEAGIIISLFSGLRSPYRPMLSELNISRIAICGSVFIQATVQRKVEIYDGLGDLHYTITTGNPLVQTYFNQGIRLIYGFNHVEALRSFQEASRLEPENAMTYWGQALALGPNLNDWNPADREASAHEAIKKAKELLSALSPVEQGLILAMEKRYDGQVHIDRSFLNELYANAMREIAVKFPNDPEVQTLYADALMNTMPWNYWNKDGSPKENTLEARKALEGVIYNFPRHPGAHHLYIHLVEASDKPGDALPSAAFLERAMPASGHLTHMPAHIYIRTGNYGKSNIANFMAIEADEKFLANSADQGMYRMGYYPHNIDFLVYGGMMNGQSRLAISQSTKLLYQIKPMEKMMPASHDFFMASPMLVMVRYGQWENVLTLPDPDSTLLISSAIAHFARGLAFLRLNKPESAKTELAKLEKISEMDTLKSIYGAFNSAHQLATISVNLLKAEINLAGGNWQESQAAYLLAIDAEDNLTYNEPPDWRLPVRHYQGAALLDMGKFEEAEKVYRKDLICNPENGWALKGLQISLEKQGRSKEVKSVQERLTKAWRERDTQINASRF